VPGAEYFVRFHALQKEATLWENAGYEVANEQLKWADSPKANYPVPATGNLTVQDNTTNIIVTGTNFSAEFSKSSGTLVKYILNGKMLISEPLRLNVFRAGVDNDKNQTSSWNTMGLRTLTVKAGTFAVAETETGNAVDLAIKNIYSGSGQNTFTSQTLFKVINDGTILVSNLIDPNVKQVVLPRIGYMLEMPKEFEKLTWYGRGPWESYPDRKEAELIDVYNATVSSQWVDYITPQEMCSKQDVRWISLSDTDGTGLVFIAPETMAASATHYRPQTFYNGSNKLKHPYEMNLIDNTVVYLDAKQRPLGNATCGQEPLEKYELRAETTVFNFIIAPITASLTNEQLTEKARVNNPVCSPVLIERGDKGKVALSTSTPDAQIYYRMDDETDFHLYSVPFDFLDGGHIEAYSKNTGYFDSMITSADLSLYIDKSKWKVISYSSHAGGAEAVTNAIDGNTSTIWHTLWGTNEPLHPHEIVVDMINTYKVRSFTYTGRPDGDNGRIKEYEIYFSNHPDVWGTPVAKGQFANVANPQSVSITAAPEARYFKLIARSEVNGKAWTSVAELDVEASAIVAEPTIPEVTLTPGINYYIKHVNSGLYLQLLSSGTDSQREGDFRLNLLRADDPNFIFKFNRASGFKSVYHIGITGKYINKGTDGWRCFIGTLTNTPDARIQLETNENGSFRMRGQWQTSKYINLDATTAGSYIYADKSTGALWTVEPVDKTGSPSVSQADGKTVIYPVPAKGSITVETQGKAKISVLDLSGKVLAAYPSGGSLTIDMNYPSGMYIVQVANGQIRNYKILQYKE
jgi:beta-galactosidase